ncbi:hypothetical protein XENTR_v10011017 [Xenopus tropicalis]|nr:hypothetical protein XENTR_v10011017 [Xenopus tropicalis]
MPFCAPRRKRTAEFGRLSEIYKVSRKEGDIHDQHPVGAARAWNLGVGLVIPPQFYVPHTCQLPLSLMCFSCPSFPKVPLLPVCPHCS